MSESRQRIHEFVVAGTGASDLADDVDIFETGLVRSMFVMQLVVFVEEEFGIVVAGDDLAFDNFRTVGAIDAFVARKLAAAA